MMIKSTLSIFAVLFALLSTCQAAFLKNQATSFCLDSNTNGDVYTLGCNGGSFQNWDLQSDYTVRNVATGFYLDSNTAGDVYALGGNGGTFQKWSFEDRGNNCWVVRNQATGFVLDSNTAGDVYTLSGNGGSFQNWCLF